MDTHVTPQTILPRLGQGTFRVMVTDAYGRRCAVTGSPVLYVPEAAHIKPYPLLLREEVHTLFDRGYLTINPEYKIEVSSRIKEEFDNGKEYYSLHGSSVLVPGDESARPALEYPSWHNDTVYRG